MWFFVDGRTLHVVLLIFWKNMLRNICFGPTLERLCAFEWPGAAEQSRAAEV